MTDLMKYNAILPKDANDYYLWYDSLKGWRLNIRGVGNHSFNAEAEILFEIERERILADVEKLRPYIDANGVNWFAPFNNIIKAIKGENK